MQKEKYNQKLDSLLTVGMLAILWFIVVYFFDFYYDLNDDVLIKDILAGVHTGTPEAHNIQMLYPLSLAISSCYKMIPTLPWYGMFLCGCHLLCFYFIGIRLVSFQKKISGKIILLMLEGLFLLGIYGYELVYVQYTVVSAILAATAAFWLYTISENFYREAVISILLVILAFMLRTEMLLLMAPFLAATGMIKWSQETEVFSKENIKKYGFVIAGILLGLGTSYLANVIAYSSEPWKNFMDFFDARTEVYDFTWYADYEENVEFYEGIQMSKAQYQLIANYNFGLDHNIDTDTLLQIAEYTESLQETDGLLDQAKRVLWEYTYRVIRNVDGVYNICIMIGYFGIVIIALSAKEWSYFWKIPMMLLFRSVPWLYMVYTGRMVDRVIHPLYFMEFMILIGVIVTEISKFRDDQKQRKVISILLCSLLCLVGVAVIPSTVTRISEEENRRMQYNAVDLALKEYTEKFSENYYYVDVYSTVTFSETMFKNVDNTMRNYDILGGWANRSPYSEAIWEEKGFHYFITSEEESIQWLLDFYEESDMMVQIQRIDLIEVAYPDTVPLQEEADLVIPNLAVYEIQGNE